MFKKTALLLAAIFVLATTGQAQNAEQRPAPAPNNSRAADSGNHSRFVHDPDSWDSTLPFQVGPIINGSPGTAAAVTTSPKYVYAHGDSIWYPPVTRPTSTTVPTTKPPSLGQATPSVSDQYRQLVQASNQSGAAQSREPRLQVTSASIAEIARQVRAERATEEKPTVIIKQDAQGKAEIVRRKD